MQRQSNILLTCYQTFPYAIEETDSENNESIEIKFQTVFLFMKQMQNSIRNS